MKKVRIFRAWFSHGSGTSSQLCQVRELIGLLFSPGNFSPFSAVNQIGASGGVSSGVSSGDNAQILT